MTDSTNPENTQLLFNEFTPPSDEAWRKAAEAGLKGTTFEKALLTKTYEGITLQPIYFQSDAASLSHQASLPGFPPYVRGNAFISNAWHIAQAIPYGVPAILNDALRFDLAQGQTSIAVVFDEPTQRGLNPSEAEPSLIGESGVSVATVADIATLFDGIDLSQYPLYIEAGVIALPLLALLVAYIQKQDIDLLRIQGCLANDPLNALVQWGTLPMALNTAYDEMAQLTRWASTHMPLLETIGVNTLAYHNGGGHAVQELGFAVATGVAYVRAMLERGLSLETITPRMRFTFALGGNFFMEVAKLRAARLLWSQVIAAFGGNAETQKMRIRTVTGLWNKTVYDPYVNMLRTTIEAFAGAIGGTDQMHVFPFDVAIRPPDEFARRIARNQQLILQQECNLTHLVDPAGGSWYVEVLTDELAKQAWGLFQEIEQHGGMVAALEAGIPQKQVQDTAQQRLDNVAKRKDVIVGVNMYPNLGEVRLPNDTFHHETLLKNRLENFNQYQAQRGAITLPERTTSDNLIEMVIESAQHDATLGEITQWLWTDRENAPSVTPIQQHRAAAAFEALRNAIVEYKLQWGYAPRIFLAAMGPIAQHKARADFTTAFYEVGGFDVVYQGGFATPEAASQAALESEASVVVICSTDDTYPALVPPIVEQIKAAKPEAVVILAGYPQDQIEAHKAAGIDDFIHIRANCYEMNLKLHQQLGVSV